MADEKDLKLVDKGKGKKKLIIIAAVLVLVLAAGGGAFLFLRGNDSAASPQPVAISTDNTAYYVAIPRPFVFNVMGFKRERLVQIKVELLVRGKPNQDLAKANVPLIESALLEVFSTATVQQLVTFEGKELLHTDALTSVVNSLTKYTGSGVVEKILFSGFVIQ